MSPNGRIHHFARYRANQDAKFAARMATVNALGSAITDPVVCLQTGGKVRVVITIYWGKGRKRCDGDNALASTKAMIDGIAEAMGIDDRRFVFAPVEQARDHEGRGYTVVVLTEDAK